jgi:hypothetical protein
MHSVSSIIGFENGSVPEFVEHADEKLTIDFVVFDDKKV